MDTLYVERLKIVILQHLDLVRWSLPTDKEVAQSSSNFRETEFQ